MKNPERRLIIEAKENPGCNNIACRSINGTLRFCHNSKHTLQITYLIRTSNSSWKHWIVTMQSITLHNLKKRGGDKAATSKCCLFESKKQFSMQYKTKSREKTCSTIVQGYNDVEKIRSLSSALFPTCVDPPAEFRMRRHSFAHNFVNFVKTSYLWIYLCIYSCT